jgi:tRNA G10  N-methylase Trm11
VTPDLQAALETVRLEIYHNDPKALAALALIEQRLGELERKADAYDRARAVVKTEGNTRAYYVLRAERAEARIADLERERDEAFRDIATMNVETVKTLQRALAAEARNEKLERVPHYDGP